jgi:hypothetical protein
MVAMIERRVRAAQLDAALGTRGVGKPSPADEAMVARGIPFA